MIEFIFINFIKLDYQLQVMLSDVSRCLICSSFTLTWISYQISGAKVVVHEPRPGSTDRIIVISGTRDETQAAQSLLQAFLLSGS